MSNDSVSQPDDFWQLVERKVEPETDSSSSSSPHPLHHTTPTGRPCSSLCRTVDAHTPSWTHVTKLDLPHCGLRSLPDDLPDVLPALEILFVSHNAFVELPAVIGRCPHLQMVAFKSNGLERIHPEALQAQLRWLILTDNCLSELPQTIGRCTSLQKLMLAGNELSALPESMADCTALELLRLSSNRLSTFPTCLRTLPNLAWLALADNVFLEGVGHDLHSSDTAAAALPILPDVPENEEEGEILGQGAGGITRKLTLTHSGRTVAVKQFGGSMTSDGAPAAERRMATATASLQLESQALIQVLGQTPDGSLVMEYLEGYRALAQPPSLQTCSRDVYETDPATGIAIDTDTGLPTADCTSTTVSTGYRRWTFAQAEPVVTALVKALTSLHRAGLTHGDFYSHNILVKETADDYGSIVGGAVHVKLSDFGAAYAYDKQGDYAHVIEQCEVRALHIWLSELNKHLLEQPSLRIDALIQASAAGNIVTMEQVLVHWRQGQLAALARAFDPDEDNQEHKQEV